MKKTKDKMEEKTEEEYKEKIRQLIFENNRLKRGGARNKEQLLDSIARLFGLKYLNEDGTFNNEAPDFIKGLYNVKNFALMTLEEEIIKLKQTGETKD